VVATRNNPGVAHQNGVIEDPQRHWKRRLEQQWIQRGSKDLVSEAEYRPLVGQLDTGAGDRRSVRGRHCDDYKHCAKHGQRLAGLASKPVGIIMAATIGLSQFGQPVRAPSSRADPRRCDRPDRWGLGCFSVMLLDTHALLWLDRDDPALGTTSSRERIASAWSSGEVAVSAISFWEVAMLADRGRVNLQQSLESWRRDWLRAGLEEIALDGAVARGATLVRADRAILEWPGALLRCVAAI
jgi:PIN domain nuclease of toxin-antitoxin system